MKKNGYKNTRKKLMCIFSITLIFYLITSLSINNIGYSLYGKQNDEQADKSIESSLLITAPLGAEENPDDGDEDEDDDEDDDEEEDCDCNCSEEGLPSGCPPPPNPNPKFIGHYIDDGWFPGWSQYWVWQEFRWVLAGEREMGCCEVGVEPLEISVCQESSISITTTLEARFSFLKGMFEGGSSIGTTMGFSSRICITTSDTLSSDCCEKSIGQFYKKQTRLKVCWNFWDGIWLYGSGTSYSQWFDLISVRWEECHFECPETIDADTQQM